MKGIRSRSGDGMAETFLCSRHFLRDELRRDRERVAARPDTDAAPGLVWSEVPNVPDRFCSEPHTRADGGVGAVAMAQAPMTRGYLGEQVADARVAALRGQAERMGR